METEEIVEEEIVETEESEESDETVETIEPWMEEEEPEDQTSVDPSKQVPVGKFVSLKKTLRGEISDRDDVIEKLKAENEELKKFKPEVTLKRPKLDDFETETLYHEAIEKYDEDRLQDTYKRNRLEEQRKEQASKAQEAVETAMNDHYDRADKLIETSGIKRDKYVAASKQAKAVFSEIFGEKANVVFDNTFARLGKGSEKLEYYIGVNKPAQEKVKALIKEDSTGLSLAMYLGQEKQRLTNPIKPRSNAPDPATNINGDENTVIGGDEKKMKALYEKAETGTTESYDIKIAARAKGFDTSEW